MVITLSALQKMYEETESNVEVSEFIKWQALMRGIRKSLQSGEILEVNTRGEDVPRIVMEMADRVVQVLKDRAGV